MGYDGIKSAGELADERDDLARRLASITLALSEVQHDHKLLEDEARRTGPDGYDPIACIQNLRKGLADAERREDEANTDWAKANIRGEGLRQRAEKAERERDSALKACDGCMELEMKLVELRVALEPFVECFRAIWQRWKERSPLEEEAERKLLERPIAGSWNNSLTGHHVVQAERALASDGSAAGLTIVAVSCGEHPVRDPDCPNCQKLHLDGSAAGDVLRAAEDCEQKQDDYGLRQLLFVRVRRMRKERGDG